MTNFQELLTLVDAVTKELNYIELNSLVLSRYASPIKQKLDETKDYTEYYTSLEYEQVVEACSHDLLDLITRAKSKLNQINNTLSLLSYENIDTVDKELIERLNKLLG